MRKVCAASGCGAWATGRGRCDVHRRAVDAERGTNQERGYGSDHRALRAAWVPYVQRGLVWCWRCGSVIGPLAAWDLGHDDERELIGPEHAGCNRAVKTHAVTELTTTQRALQETTRRLGALLLAGAGDPVVVKRAYRWHADGSLLGEVPVVRLPAPSPVIRPAGRSTSE
jgi:hypothetical protein